jgi:hypothetical protein
MLKYFKLVSLIVLAAFLGAISIQAAETGNVTATVTAQNISVAVTDGSVSYGVISVSDTQDTTTGGVNDSQTATNDGNITEDFNVRGFDTTGWTLGASAGSEIYTHKFCTSNCDSSPTWTALTTSYQTLASGVVATSGTQVFDLQIGTPTSTSVYTQQTATVTVQAVSAS